jgi:hypothetical protein
MKNQNKSNWASLLREAVITNDRTPIGEGWETIKNLADQHCISLSTAARKIRILLEEGKVERFEGTQDGKLKVWYKQVKPKR